MFYRTKDDFNVWLSTFHEALRSPYTATMTTNWNGKVIEFAKECADEALKAYQDSNIVSRGNRYDECDV